MEMINLLATSYLILESETLAFLEFLKEVPVFFSVCFIKIEFIFRVRTFLVL